MHIGLTHLESTSSTSIGDVEAVVIYLRTPTSFGHSASEGDSAVSYAASTGNDQCLEALLNAGGDRKTSSNWRIASRGMMMLKFMEKQAREVHQKQPDQNLREFATEVFRR